METPSLNNENKLLLIESVQYFLARCYTQLARIEEKSGKDSIAYKRLFTRYQKYQVIKTFVCAL